MNGNHRKRPKRPYINSATAYLQWEDWAQTQEKELRDEKARLERYGFTDRDDYLLILKLLGKEASS